MDEGENNTASASPSTAAAGPSTAPSDRTTTAAGPSTAPSGHTATAAPSAALPTTTTDDEDDFVLYGPIRTSPIEVIGKGKAPITKPADQLRDELSKAGISSAAQGSSAIEGMLGVEPLKTTRTLLPAPSSRPGSNQKDFEPVDES